MPPNSTKFEMNFEAAFARVSNVEINIRSFNDPMTAPVEVLSWLAWERSVDVWNKSWSDAQKRQVIKTSLYNHSIKGTVESLEVALNSLGFPVIVQEWFNMVPIGKPYTFKLYIQTSQDSVSATDYKELFKVVRAYKNLRSHLVDTTVILESPSNLQVNATLQAGHDTEFLYAAGGLYLDGSWSLDGTKKLNGVDM
ncbi:phage tail protein I [Acinetobacter pittii]|uniref:phage tail protein I n=1 Tax=Acinetobacter pittii TaxID=48296 RepID=UPI003F5414F5